MGQIINIKCNKCKVNMNFNLGTGMRETGREGVVTYCNSCREYSLQYESYEDGVLYASNSPEDKTPAICKCGGILNKIYSSEMFTDGKRINCPACSEELEIKRVGLFD